MLALPCGHLLGCGGNIALCGLFQLTDAAVEVDETLGHDVRQVLLVEVVGEALGEAEESSEESPLFSAMIAMTAMSITTMTAAIAPIMRPVFGPFFFGCPP